MKKVYITGICGMVGSHLADYLLASNGNKIEVFGSYFKPTTDITELPAAVKIVECDVRYLQGVLSIIQDFFPDVIYHLAAQSYPPVSWLRPQETCDINVTGTINIFESIKIARKFKPDYDPVVVVACSSAQYGQSMLDSEGFVNESAPLLPLSPYGVSKVTQDLLAYQYFKSDNIRTIRARIFNTTGPKKVGDVLSDFTRRAVLLKRKSSNKLAVGNINTLRAITDVRDLAPALDLLSVRGKPGDAYNICGANVYKISDLVKIIEDKIGFQLNCVVDKQLLRPTDEKIIFGDTSKLFNDTGWKQSIPIEKTIEDMIFYWENKIR